MHEHPKILYRAGDALEWEGRKLATLIVEDVKAEEAALAAGWQRVEDFIAGKAAAVAKAVKPKAK